MKEKIEKIVSEYTGKVRKAKTLYDLAIASTEINERLNTLFAKRIVSQQRELLIGFARWITPEEYVNDEMIKKDVDTYLDN